MCSKQTIIALIVLLTILPCQAQTWKEIDKFKTIFTEFPKHTPTDKTIDAPITGNGDIGLTMTPSSGKIIFYVGKNDFWKAVESIPEGRIALPGGLTIESDFFRERCYVAEQLPGSAELRASFKNIEEELNICAWVPALDNKVVIELESNTTLRLKLQLWTPNGSESVTEQGVDNGCAWVHRSFDNLQYLKWPTYMALAMNRQNEEVTIFPRKKQIVVLSIYTNHETQEWHKKAIQGVSSLSENVISDLREQHRRWWNSFWSLSSVRFEDEFLEQYYYQSQYLFACSSREDKFAPGIWGPFITTDHSSWRGDYHLNYNFQAPYWASFSSNHISLTENYDQPLLDYMESGKKHAYNLFHCRGVLYPVGIGPKGFCSSAWPRNRNIMKSEYGYEDNTIEDGVAFWQQKINASFSMANMMIRFYSTYDNDYARKIYPFVKACAEFWEDYLSYEEGRYVVRGDVFNETPPWKNYEGDFNSLLSLGLIRMTFKGVESLSCYLNKDIHKRKKWKTILEKLSTYPVGYKPNGKRSLCRRETKEISPMGINQIHMHGLLLPAGVVGPYLNPEINKIMMDDLLAWDSSISVDWGTTMGNGIETIYPGAVRVGFPAKEILRHLKDRIMMGSYPNCYIYAKGGGIETLSAVPNTINEMMMQSYEGLIRIFPNWDKSMNGSFNTLRAYGAFLVSSSIKDGVIGPVTIKSEQGRPCKVENPWPNHTVKVMRNGKMWKMYNGTCFEFKTKKGDIFELTI